MKRVILAVLFIVLGTCTAFAESMTLQVADSYAPSSAYSVSIEGKDNALQVSGTVNQTGYVFGKLYVDGVELKDFTGKTTIAKQTVSLDKFSTGYHTAFLQLYDKSTGNVARLIFKEKIPYSTITAKPTYKGVLNVRSKSLDLYPYNMTLENQKGPLYFEYKDGKTWKTSGSMQANAIQLYIQQGFVIKKLKPNTKYQTRLRYGQYATYGKITPSDMGLTLEQFQGVLGTSKTYLGDGKSYFFGGPALKCKTIKTGKKNKPSVKSVTVKAVNIKFHKHRVAGHYEWTGYHYVWIGPFTEKYYTCNYKVTVKLKKKTGAKGLWINGKYLKGDKKVYTTKFTPYPNYFSKKPPKGLKYKVRLKSYQNKSYGGFSPTYSKKVKVK